MSYVKYQSLKFTMAGMLCGLLSACHANYNATVTLSDEDIIVKVNENNILGQSKNTNMPFCLYRASILNQDGRQNWSMQSESGLCKTMESLNLYHIPSNFTQSSELSKLSPGKYSLSMEIGGGSVKSLFYVPKR